MNSTSSILDTTIPLAKPPTSIGIPPNKTVYSESTGSLTAIQPTAFSNYYEFVYTSSTPLSLFLSTLISNAASTDETYAWSVFVPTPQSTGGTTEVYPAYVVTSPTMTSKLNLGDLITIRTSATATVYLPVRRPLSINVDVGKLYESSPSIVSKTLVPSLVESSSTTSRSPTPDPTLEPDRVSLVTGSFAAMITVSTLLAFALGCVAAYFILRRSKNGKAQAPEAPRKHEAGEKDLHSISVSQHGEHAATAGFVGLSGWQKHLPQDEGDSSTQSAVQEIFTKCQLLVEGFYRDTGPPNLNSTSVEFFRSDDVPITLLQTGAVLDILEGVLVRWIVHKISLKAAVKDSLLPSQYCALPARNGLHMEVSDHENGYYAVAQSNRGLLQAFAQWKVLTSFLYEKGSPNDPNSERTLSNTIKSAVKVIDEALLPWVRPNTSVKNRHQSLEEMLKQASDIGRRLFMQHSIFMFDWQSKRDGSTFVVTPALKRLGENGSVVKVLIQSRQIPLNE